MRKVFLFYFLKECPVALFWNFAVATLLTEGSTLEQASLQLGLFYLAMAAVEVPTGYLADRFGRRLASWIGLTLLGLGFLVKAGSSAGPAVSLAFILAAFGLTVMSGAVDAWLRNIVKQRQAGFSDSRYFISIEIIGRLATILSSWLAVWILNLSPSLLWSVAGGSALAAVLVSFWIPSDQSGPRARLESAPSRGILKELTRPCIALFLGSSIFFGIETGIRSVIAQPYVLELGGGFRYLAYFQMSLAIARLAGVLLYRFRLASLGRDFQFVLLALLTFGAAEFNAALAPSFARFMGPYALAVFTLGWLFPLRLAFINQRIPDSCRATILSADSMALKTAAGLVCFQLAGSQIMSQLRLGWGAGAAALFLSMAFFFQSGRVSEGPRLADPVPSSG